MIEIIAMVMGVVTLFRGKFTLTKGRVLTGWRARVCGGVLLCHIPIVALVCLLLADTRSLDQTTILAVSITSLATVIASSYALGFSLFRGQEEALPQNPVATQP